MLALLAAVTTKIRLQTGILVLPYRNPFIVARDVATLDRYSNGRVTLSRRRRLSQGRISCARRRFRAAQRADGRIYARAQALAHAARNSRSKERGTRRSAIASSPVPCRSRTRRCWWAATAIAPSAASSSWAMAGTRFSPRRSAAAAARAGRGASNTTRTAAMETEQDLVAGIAYMKEHCEKVGRKDMPDVILGGINSPGETMLGPAAPRSPVPFPRTRRRRRGHQCGRTHPSGMVR